jgi:hypothetical protein
VDEASDLEQQGTKQRQAFRDKYGYPAHAIPDIWVGQRVHINLEGLTRADGMLEAVTPEGYVLSTRVDRAVFIPRQAVLRFELYNPALHDIELEI